MLKDVLTPKSVKELTPNERKSKKEVKSRKVYEAYTTVLQDNTLFPNQEINTLVTYIEHKKNSNQLALVFDYNTTLPPRLVLPETSMSGTPAITSPADFYRGADLFPVFALCAVVEVASRTRDYFEHISNNSAYIDLRANAFRAETLLTIQKIAQDEHIDLGWNPYKIIMEENLPPGLHSLAPGIHYPTSLPNQ